MIPPHPIQPIVTVREVQRFKKNEIVCYLLDHGGIDLNDLACVEFSREDREQFAQLTGRSLSGAPDQSEEVRMAAERMLEGESEQVARNHALREQLKTVREGMRAGVAVLFGVCEEDLSGD